MKKKAEFLFFVLCFFFWGGAWTDGIFLCWNIVHRIFTKSQEIFLLILPIQRIPRYKILLEEIVKNTEVSHPDLQPLQEALEKIKEVVILLTLNERIKENSRREQVKAVEDRFGGSIVLLAPARRFVMEGSLCKIERRDDRDYVFFLFTDCLVYGSQTFVGNLKYQNLLPIDSAFDVREPQPKPQTEFGHIFEIHSSVESFYAYTEEEEIKKMWIEAMTKLVCLKEEREQTKQIAEKNDFKARARPNPDLIAAPLFVPDDFSSSCMMETCQVKFTFMERRHHCYYW
ncbi:hypothetical protein RFI_06492 [Reticulomyxa filosa]|uniref:DH domain-containing protein n=1 Tax=Reticulomyxa filosa TaxID=46433 RepID=X6NXS5_RETFI|nr:hypothetical protein RFI_06492 [Reticulomyxa filosa]|eukprot:ETO30629.1 hypothetical protein RFI_06492 [Reticulomyxa filosa]